MKDANPPRPVVTGRRFRPAWSLAAAHCAPPRIGAAGLIVGAIVVFQFARMFPRWRDPAVGAVFAVLVCAGAIDVVRGLRRLVGERRRRSRGGVPWWRDRDWPESAVERRVASGVRQVDVSLTLAVFATAECLAWSHSVAWSAAGVGMTPWSSMGPLVIATHVVALVWVAVVLRPRVGRGRLVVAWPTFPQFTGDRAAFHLATSPGGARIDGVRVFLRCVRFQNRSAFVPWPRSSRLAWVAEARLAMGAYIGPESHLRLEIQVPPDAPPTDLHAAGAVRWELLVVGTVAGADYADCVTVPVYAVGR